MALKRYANNAWTDVINLKRYASNAWTDCASAKVYKNGAWEQVWGGTIEPVGVCGYVINDSDLESDVYGRAKIAESEITLSVEYGASAYWAAIAFPITTTTTTVSFDYVVTGIPEYLASSDGYDTCSVRLLQHTDAPNNSSLNGGTLLGVESLGNISYDYTGTYTNQFTTTVGRYLYLYFSIAKNGTYDAAMIDKRVTFITSNLKINGKLAYGNMSSKYA